MGRINRRRFIGQAAAASLLGVTASSLLGCAEKAAEQSASKVSAAKMLDKISVQLYTLRNEMKEGVPAVLTSLNEIGYDQVEFAGYFDHSPAQIRQMLDDAGLTSPSAHISLEQMLDGGDDHIEAAGIVGHEYLIVPWMNESLRGSVESYKNVCGQLNDLGRKCKAGGVKLAYHNHAFEFEALDGQIPFDVMLEECDPELVNFQLDLFWITDGGQDPLAYIAKYPGRFPLCHVKDRMADGSMVDVGKGVIDFEKIFSMADTAGLKYFVVEHDNPDDALASVRASYEYLSAL